jgi:hypothetical protein
MKLNWQDAPTQTQWGHDMVAATVALGKDHSVDMYCERSKTAEAEALLKKPWVGLTDGERLKAAGSDAADEWFWEVVEAIEAKLKEKNT